MRKLREVLRLRYSAQLSIRQISASSEIRVGRIQHLLKRAEQHQLTWPLPDELDDCALAASGVLKVPQNGRFEIGGLLSSGFLHSLN